jgi:hypothetical protein
MATIFDGICAFGTSTPYSMWWVRDLAEMSSEFLGTLMFAFFGSLASNAPSGTRVSSAPKTLPCWIFVFEN